MTDPSQPQRGNSIVAFLRKVLEQNNDFSPEGVLAVPNPDQEMRARINEFAQRLHELGYIESTMGDAVNHTLLRVRVTPAGMDYLAEHATA